MEKHAPRRLGYASGVERRSRAASSAAAALTVQSTAVDYVGYTSNQENTRARSLLAITLAIVRD